jgi:hypothetical protein
MPYAASGSNRNKPNQPDLTDSRTDVQQIKKLFSWFTARALNFLFVILTNLGDYFVVYNGNISKRIISFLELFLNFKACNKSVIIFGT